MAILMLAMLPPAILNGYPMAYPCVSAEASQDPGADVDATQDVVCDDQEGVEDPAPTEDAPATGTPVIRLELLGSASIDCSWRAFRTFSPARSRSLPVGLWHGQSLSVPRPFSRLDRVVAMSHSDALSFMTLARRSQPHAPPSFS